MSIRPFRMLSISGHAQAGATTNSAYTTVDTYDPCRFASGPQTTLWGTSVGGGQSGRSASAPKNGKARQDQNRTEPNRQQLYRTQQGGGARGVPKAVAPIHIHVDTRPNSAPSDNSSRSYQVQVPEVAEGSRHEHVSQVDDFVVPHVPQDVHLPVDALGVGLAILSSPSPSPPWVCGGATGDKRKTREKGSGGG